MQRRLSKSAAAIRITDRRARCTCLKIIQVSASVICFFWRESWTAARTARRGLAADFWPSTKLAPRLFIIVRTFVPFAEDGSSERIVPSAPVGANCQIAHLVANRGACIKAYRLYRTSGDGDMEQAFAVTCARVGPENTAAVRLRLATSKVLTMDRRREFKNAGLSRGCNCLFV